MTTRLARVPALGSLCALLTLGCLDGGPLPVGDDVEPAACRPGSLPDAGSTPISRSISLWMSDGFVRDMRAAGIEGRGDYNSDFQVADAFSGYVGYGMDVVALHQRGTLASTFDLAPVGGPTSLVIGDWQDADSPIVPRTGYWLARLVYDGMTKAVETTTGDVTIRESPGGRVHCELSQKGHRLNCAFRGVIRADFY